MPEFLKKNKLKTLLNVIATANFAENITIANDVIEPTVGDT